MSANGRGGKRGSRESERAREARTSDRGRSSDRIRGVAERGNSEGGPRNDRYEDGITRGPLASTHDSLSFSSVTLAPSSSR